MRVQRDVEFTPSRWVLPDEAWLAVRARFSFSDRELETVQHIFDGCSVARAAYLMGVEPSTAQEYIRRVYTKTGAHDHVELVLCIFTEYLHGSSNGSSNEHLNGHSNGQAPHHLNGRSRAAEEAHEEEE